MDQPFIPSRRLSLWLALAMLLIGIYGLTGSKLRFGYEGANIEQAEAILAGQTVPRPEGGFEPYSQAGLADMAVYLPTGAVSL